MGKTKKRKKNPPQPQKGRYKYFLNEVYNVVKKLMHDDTSLEMSSKYKRIMFGYNIKIRNPIAGNHYVNSQELKLIGNLIKMYYRDRIHEYDDSFFSCYDIQLIHCFLRAKGIEYEKQFHEYHPDALEFKCNAEKLIELFHSYFIVNCFSIITKLSAPDYKYYGLNVDFAPMIQDNPKMELEIKIHGFPSQKITMEVNGYKRPAFRLGKPVATFELIEWVSLDTDLFGDYYKGTKKKLEVYIQSHALLRLKERLDILDKESINFALWLNTINIDHFDIYRGYLLIPFNIFDVKTGYLAAQIIDDKLLICTFLFVTHNHTPEGDRLQKISGLNKQDIIYWGIDRLSTFMNLDEEKHFDLFQLFSDAGLGELVKLKYKELSIDSMQVDSLDGLSEYINKGICETLGCRASS